LFWTFSDFGINSFRLTLPGLYTTDHIPVQDKIILCHFFIGDCDWYVCEYDGIDTFFGFAILNGDTLNAEWGLIGYNELKIIKVNGCQIALSLCRYFHAALMTSGEEACSKTFDMKYS
jgi:hypothetical protein